MLTHDILEENFGTGRANARARARARQNLACGVVVFGVGVLLVMAVLTTEGITTRGTLARPARVQLRAPARAPEPILDDLEESSDPSGGSDDEYETRLRSRAALVHNATGGWPQGFARVTKGILRHHIRHNYTEADPSAATKTRQTIQDVFALYPDITDVRGQVVQAKILRLFLTVVEFFGACGIEFWLEYGTLLGWWRDRRLLRYDHDVDFGLDQANWARLIDSVDILPRWGCHWKWSGYRHHGRNKGIIACDWLHPSAMEGADIYGFASNRTHHFPPVLGNCAWGSETDYSLPCADCPVPVDFVKPLMCNATLHGVAGLCVPAKPRTYLKRVYGSLARGARCNRRLCCTDDTAALLPRSHRRGVEIVGEDAFAASRP